MWLNKVVRNIHHTVNRAIAHRCWERNRSGSVHPMTDTCLPSAGALNSFPTAESRHAKDPGPRGCCVPGEMHIFVWTIRWTVAWANRVSNDVSPGTTEQPISARSEEHTSELQSPDHLVCR